jgi:trigger factor
MSVVMQVTMEKVNQHERKLNVTIPAEQVQEELKQKLTKIGKTARLRGFRQGKVPKNVIEKTYGQDARYEVISTLVQSSLQDAIRQENVVPANRPTVDIVTNEEGKPLEFNAVFEVYPEVDLKGIDKIHVDKPTVEISEADLTEALTKLSKQYIDWKTVDRKSAHGDRLTVNLVGTLEGEDESFTDIQDMKIELGAGQMIPGFEDNLIGVSANQEISFVVPFPEDYWEAKLASKPARFDLSVLTVEGAESPDFNDAFAEKVGIKEGGLEKLKERLKEGLANEAQHLLNQELKQQVLDQLLAANTIEVPQSLINTELEMLNRNPGAAKLDDNQSIEDNAKRRVALSLLLGQYIKQEGIALDQDKVKQAVRQMAMNYPNPEEIIKWFYQDFQRLSGVASMVLEDQAVEKLLEAVKPSDKKLSYQEIAKKFETQGK